MNSIRFRIFALILICTLATGAFCYKTISAYNNMTILSKALEQSYFLENYIQNLDVNHFRTKKLELLQEHRQQLLPENRQMALSHIIQSYSNRSFYKMKRQIQFFIKNEKEFRRYSYGQVKYYESRIDYFGIITVTGMIICFLTLLIYVQNSIFKPLQDLSKKMMDFLHHKYTYQFNVLSLNEVGHLQSTFNSLAQRVLEQMNELKSLDQAKSDFLSIASHELRTPLTSVKGSLSLLNSGLLGTLDKEALNLIIIAQNETDRLIRLINDLLDLAKIEARKFPLEKKWAPLPFLIKDTVAGIKGLAQQTEINIIADEVSAVDINMDADRIQQVMTNLISNAIKYSPKGTAVTLRTAINEHDEIIVEIIDQGKGIAPEDQEHIFQKFRQVTGPDNPIVKGTGLGLAIAKALVEGHGGVIGVKSAPGKGCHFHFTLPEWRFTQADLTEMSAA